MPVDKDLAGSVQETAALTNYEAAVNAQVTLADMYQGKTVDLDQITKSGAYRDNPGFLEVLKTASEGFAASGNAREKTAVYSDSSTAMTKIERGDEPASILEELRTKFPVEPAKPVNTQPPEPVQSEPKPHAPATRTEAVTKAAPSEREPVVKPSLQTSQPDTPQRDGYEVIPAEPRVDPDRAIRLLDGLEPSENVVTFKNNYPYRGAASYFLDGQDLTEFPEDTRVELARYAATRRYIESGGKIIPSGIPKDMKEPKDLRVNEERQPHMDIMQEFYETGDRGAAIRKLDSLLHERLDFQKGAGLDSRNPLSKLDSASEVSPDSLDVGPGIKASVRLTESFVSVAPGISGGSEAAPAAPTEADIAEVGNTRTLASKLPGLIG